MLERFTFKKEERLCSRILLEKMFTEGKSIFSFPFKIIYLPVQPPINEEGIQVVFSVPKRSFKQAVKRNLLRRRMREAYRLNKAKLFADLAVSEIQVAVMFIYIDKVILEYRAIEKGMIKGIEKLKKSINANK